MKEVLMKSKETVKVDEVGPTPAETAAGLRLISSAMIRKQLHANEVALKGLHVDWLFSKLNLTRYR